MGDKLDCPMVSICIPTYNRSVKLKKAVESAVGQSYSNVQVIVLDNASTDDSGSVVNLLMRKHSNIEYFRNKNNIGAAGNFNKVMSLSKCEYSMWLADDDWIDSDYVTLCMGTLLLDKQLALVSGRCIFFDEKTQVLGERLTLRHGSGWCRLLKYYLFVNENSLFYGVYRRSAATQIQLLDKCGSDWHFIAAVAFQGKVDVIDGACIYRSLAGASSALGRAAKQWGEPRWVQAEPYLGSAAGAFFELMNNKVVYGDSPWLVRALFASIVFSWICIKKVISRRCYRAMVCLFEKFKRQWALLNLWK